MHLPGSFPVLLQLGHVGDSGMWEMCKECRGAGPVLRGALRAAEFRGEGLAPGTSWKSISAGVSGAPGREMLLAGAGGCSRQQWGVDVQRAWGRGCLSPQGVPPCSKESLMCWEGAQTQQSETPAQARAGATPHSQLWGL